MNDAEPSLFRRMLRSWKLRGAVLFLALVYGWFEFNEWRWERKWNQYVAESRARGVKLFIGEFLPKEPVPDEENFAATPIWREVFATGKTNGTIGSKFAVQMPRTNAKNAKSQTRPARMDLAGWRASMVTAKKLTAADADLTDGAAVLRGLEFLKPEFDEIRASVKRPKVHFPVNWEEGFNARLPHFNMFQALARFFSVSVTAKLADGDAAGAFDDWKTSWALAEKLDDEPSLIADLVQISAIHMAIGTLREGIEEHRWTEGQLKAIQEILAATNPIRRGVFCISSERGIFNTSIEPSIGKVEMFNVLGIGSTNGGIDSVAHAIRSLRARTRNWWRQNQLWYNRFLDEELTMLDAEAEMMKPQSRQFDVTLFSGFWTQIDLGMALESAPVYQNVGKKFFHTHATVRMAGLACALERFRIANARYPERLEELTPQFIGKLPHDPCDGQPFRYRITPEGYLLYSIGMDCKDDGGKVNDVRDADLGPDWRWWSPER